MHLLLRRLGLGLGLVLRAGLLQRLAGGLSLVLDRSLALCDALELIEVSLEGVRAASLVDLILRLVGELLEVDHPYPSYPGFFLGTKTARLNSATSVPSWL